MMKAKLILFTKTFEHLDEILGNEESKKFKSAVSVDEGKIEISIESESLPGIQAAINSYINKLKVISSTMNIKRI